MYVKIISDTLKISLNHDYEKWAKACSHKQQYRFAGYDIFSSYDQVIDSTTDARESLTYFNQNMIVIGKSKAGSLALDFDGNLYNCGKTLRRLDRNIGEFTRAQTEVECATNGTHLHTHT